MAHFPYQELVLEAVGIADVEERIYRAVIERPGRTVRQVAEATALTERDARRGLRFLEEKGLVTLTAGSPQRFRAAPPDLALEALVRQRQDELEQVRVSAAQFAEQVRNSEDVASPLEVIEVISGARAMTQRFHQLERQAQREICVLDRPPYLRVDGGEGDRLAPSPTEANPLEVEQLASGMTIRGIYDQAALSLPGRMDLVEKCVRAGEQARVMVGLPAKLTLIDARIAFVPLYPVVSGGLVIHPSPLVDALVVLFDAMWERAVPIGGGRQPPDEEITEREQELLILLAAGQKDEVIARRLGVTTRTVQRLVSDLMRRLGVSTRYQAGLQAARRGWH